jgi:amino-acid N-acetyltransferase
MIRAAALEDWPAIEGLLQACGLPLAGAREHFDAFVVAEAGAIAGCVGAEVYGEAALLRSLAVADASRGRGIARALVNDILERLRGRGVRQVGLLTTTADRFFIRFGFVAVGREELPRALDDSQELKGACPANATVMVLKL